MQRRRRQRQGVFALPAAASKRDPSASPGGSDDNGDLSLSVTSNINLLRSKLLRELLQRRRGLRQQVQSDYNFTKKVLY